ncbi:MAG: hypothetical protein ACR2QE_10070 [Acidimicrobiales bacterium]
MPRPLPGMVAIAEFGSRFAADLASARLTHVGIDSAVLGDPASTVAPHHVTERWFSVCVREEAADEAREALADEVETPAGDDHDAPFSRRFRDRPGWIRALTWALIIAIPVPILLSLVLVVFQALRSLFP